MTRVSKIAGHWFGLCPKPPAVHALKAGIDFPAESVHDGSPDGGSSGPGTIRLGIGSALSGMRTLNRNRQLLWCTFLVGLVLAGNTLAQSALPYLGGTIQPYLLVWLVQNFIIEFATLFCLVFFLAGLILSISSKKGGPISFFEGLAGAIEYCTSIFWWSLILAFAGVGLFMAYTYFPGCVPRDFLFLDIFRPNILISTFIQFPFNFALEPKMLTEGFPGDGGRLLLRWIYPFGFLDALVYSAINLLLLVLTQFVVPLLVIEQKTLKWAVMGSCTLMRKTWDEVVVCTAFLGVIVFGAFLTYLLVQVAHGAPVVTYRTTDTWLVLGLLYDLALFGVAIVMTTVGGIAVLDLFRSARTGRLPGSLQPRSLP